MRQLEHELQKACVNYFRYQYPKEMIFAIPNGGVRNKITARKLKAEGVLAGVADIMIPIPKYSRDNRLDSAGLFLEMKVGYNKQTPSQKAFDKYVTRKGYHYRVIYTIEQFIAIVEAYMG